VRHAMDGLKESKQAVGAATLAAVNNLAPPTILAQASRLNFSTRLFNLLVTNIPGPQLPLYLRGRQLQELFPVAFLPEDHALAVAIMSYHGGLDYGLLGDYDAMPDIDLVADGIEASLAELLAAARGRRPRAAAPTGHGTPDSDVPAVEHGGPAPIVPADHGRRTKHGPAADMRAKRERGSRPARKRTQD
jgi:diacylglycerol O-acyltransferase / wax synthase